MNKRFKKDKAKLIELYDQIPEVVGCIEGCNECCGIVPVHPVEADTLKLPTNFTADTEALKVMNASTNCSLLCEEGCSSYNDRPFLCRLFGASEEKMMTCPHGAKAENPLSKKRTQLLTNRYKKMQPT